MTDPDHIATVRSALESARELDYSEVEVGLAALDALAADLERLTKERDEARKVRDDLLVEADRHMREKWAAEARVEQLEAQRG